MQSIISPFNDINKSLILYAFCTEDFTNTSDSFSYTVRARYPSVLPAWTQPLSEIHLQKKE